ncbi:MAG: ABC transporter permease [Chloroflexi bacterium]|nr:ABC transporter permease [Anaerolineaceae bacterium]NMB87967.1 ABC transporter permease [Chloroflexota bacterium]
MERWTQNPRLRQAFLSLAQSLVAILLAMLAGTVMLLIVGANPLEAYAVLLKGAFGGWPAFARTLRMASPILITGLAVVVAFRAGFIYLGMEGALYVGALSATLCGIYVSPGLPTFLHLPAALLAGCLAGGLWAFIPALLRARWRVDEVVSTLMLNYIAILLVDHLVYAYFQDPAGGTNAERALTLPIPATARLPFVDERYGLSFSIILGLVLVVALLWVYSRSVWGYESDMTGLNRRFAHYGGVNTLKMALTSMVASGVIAGLAGAAECLGNYGRYIGGFSSDFGFDGVTVALMGRLNPLGALLSAIFFGALKNGGSLMELEVNVPRDMVVVLQGLILLIVTAQTLFVVLRLNAQARPEE